MPQFLSLPGELQNIITNHLPYPDLLALKHTHPKFYHSIQPTLCDRVNWLLERPAKGLPFPQGQCIMKTDQQFCSSNDVKAIMARRRKHIECALYGGGKCMVVQGMTCKGSLAGPIRKRMVAGRTVFGSWQDSEPSTWDTSISPSVHGACGILFVGLALSMYWLCAAFCIGKA